METHFEPLQRAHSAMARKRVLDDLRSLARDAEDLVKATAGDVGYKAREAQSQLAAHLAKAKAAYQEIEDRSLVQAKAAAVKTDALVRQYPYCALGAAFFSGLILGWLAGRSGKSD